MLDNMNQPHNTEQPYNPLVSASKGLSVAILSIAANRLSDYLLSKYSIVISTEDKVLLVGFMVAFVMAVWEVATNMLKQYWKFAVTKWVH